MSELNELKLECGVTLKLQPVKQTIALEFISRFGFDILMRGDASQLKANARPEVMDGFVKLLNYFAGWGVANAVPQEARDEFGMLASGERSIRSLWVRDILTPDEVSQLFAQVMALTFSENGRGHRTGPSGTVPQGEEALKAKVAELEARLEKQDG
jgi:hypothetical protein